jgi:hypothetical protein
LLILLIFTRGVTLYGIWIGDRIYWNRLYTACAHTSQFAIIHTHNNVHSHVFTSRCSVAAINGGRYPSSGFPNYPQPQLPAFDSNSSQQLSLSSPLTHSLTDQPTLHFTSLNRLIHSSQFVTLITSEHGSHRNTVPHCCTSIVAMGKRSFVKSLFGNFCYVFAHIAVVAQQMLYMPQYL